MFSWSDKDINHENDLQETTIFNSSHLYIFNGVIFIEMEFNNTSYPQ